MADITVVRIEADDDESLADVAVLLTAKRIRGQPTTCAELVRQTLTRRDVFFDGGFYADLEATHLLGLRHRGELVGAVAYGDTTTGGRDLLWAVADDAPGYRELVARTFAGWTGPARACAYAPTVSLGLAGNPRMAYPDLHDALVDAGFEGRDLWSYQVAVLRPAGEAVAALDTVRGSIEVEGREVASYVVSTPFPGHGVLWWFGVSESFRGHGYGTAAARAAIRALAERGAETAIAFVDDDDPGGLRDRSAAFDVLRRVGFVEFDRLFSYERPAP